MDRMKNKEFRLSVSNLVAAEEHIIEMMCSAETEETKKMLFNELKSLKTQRNMLLTDNGKEPDRDISFNKWCLLKHLLLSQYHLMEWVNQSDREFEEVEKVLPLIKNFDEILSEISVKDIETDCKICPDDLIIPKMLKSIFKKG